MKRRIVVTGIGLVTPHGCEPAMFWEKVCSGRSALRRLTESDGPEFAGRIGAMVPNFDPRQYIAESKTIRLMTRAVAFGVAASQLAATDARLDVSVLTPARVGVFVGSRGHSSDRQELLPAVEVARDNSKLSLDRFGKEGLGLINPTWLLKGLANNVLYFISLKYGAQGMNNNISMGGASATMAIGEALHAIRGGYVDVAFAGGYDSMLEVDRLELYDPSGLLSRWKEEPERASRPFDRRRDGFLLSEGACFLVLEELGSAERRGAKIYGEVLGYGNVFSSPGQRTTFGPTAEGFERALRNALDDAACSENLRWPTSNEKPMDAVFAHGLATPASDIEETRALKSVSGRDAYAIPVPALKSMLGNTLAASGAIEAAAALFALRDGCLPPTINCEEPDPACDLDYVAGKTARAMSLKRVALNNANLGGAHAALVLSRVEG